VLLLALDTSTSAVTVALHDGSTVVASSTVVDARGHGERLAPGILHVLGEAGAAASDLTDVVVGVGPGPFTGLRVGVVTARMLGLAAGACVHGICSLDALAHACSGAVTAGGLLVATDARRKEIYWARYAVTAQTRFAGTGPARIEGPAVDRPAELAPWVRDLPTAGRGPLLYPDLFAPATEHDLPLDVSAAVLADLAVRRLARGEDLDPPEPLYLRRPDVAPAAAVKSVLV
jgi:tRNA threonylcarbamoyl adenosine modification protein YeaZ